MVENIVMENKEDIYVVQVTKPPTYIKNLTNKDDEIILVHSKIRNIAPSSPDDSFVSPEDAKDVANSMSLLDITGSPLKTSFNNSLLIQKSLLDEGETNWTVEEESHYPLTLQQARRYLTDYFDKHTSSKMVWCVCDGQDKDRTVLAGFQKYQNFIKSTAVRLLGYIPEKLKDEHLDVLNKKHNFMHFEEQKRESCSFYEIYGSPINECDKKMETAKKGYVTLKVNEGTQNKIKLGIQVLVGHPHAASVQLWEELLRLELYINLFSQYDNSEQKRDGFWFPASNQNDALDPRQLVLQIIHERDLRSIDYQERTKNIIHIVENVFERDNLDITDKLWSVLIRCSSYDMLVDCLNIFMTEIAYNRTKVYIADGNESWIAGLLKGIVSGVTPVPTFTGTQPIQFLILLGIEKFRKDYVYIFTQTNVITEKQINAYLKFDKNEKKQVDLTRKFIVLRETQLVDINDISYKMTILGRLETLCELLCLVPQDWLRYVSDTAVCKFLGTDSPIDSFTSLASGRFYELNADLPARAIVQHESVSMPVQITKSVESLSQYLHMLSVLHMSLKPIFPPCIYGEDKNDLTEIKHACYHFTTVNSTVHYYGKMST